MHDNSPPGRPSRTTSVGFDDDPYPLRGGVCDKHGEFNNFSGRCLACIPTGDLLRRGDA